MPTRCPSSQVKCKSRTSTRLHKHCCRPGPLVQGLSLCAPACPWQHVGRTVVFPSRLFSVHFQDCRLLEMGWWQLCAGFQSIHQVHVAALLIGKSSFQNGAALTALSTSFLQTQSRSEFSGTPASACKYKLSFWAPQVAETSSPSTDEGCMGGVPAEGLCCAFWEAQPWEPETLPSLKPYNTSKTLSS